ncbi:putative membrane protein YvbJ [Metabacillus crassostreae]|uniref:zinc ribbon domain-containing protein n=1 Tax=Metabacillus crassostreae TaxID=929098 RepID=UPI00195ED062|nr:zinc ribbon domain-containing protein [Metabacillus crassostreae]MBM7602453.1 putative membrane protein YvbJ [Metabacillus crassostreae]
MYCENCGEELQNNSQYCKNCGDLTNKAYSYKVFNLFSYIVGLVFSPLLGVIMGIVGLVKRKKHAWSIIVVSLIGWVINALLIGNL